MTTRTRRHSLRAVILEALPPSRSRVVGDVRSETKGLNMTDQEAIVFLAAKVFGWVQDGDPHGFRFRKDGGTIGNFIPDHEPGDAGIVIDKMNTLGFTTFHYELTEDGKWKAYFNKPEWEMIAQPN